MVGGCSKIASHFIKRHHRKFIIDITTHSSVPTGLPDSVNNFSLDLSENSSIKKLSRQLVNYRYDGILFFSGTYWADECSNQKKLEESIKVNFLSSLELLDSLKLNNSSKIIFFTDEGISQPKRNYLSYSFSKALLQDYIRLLAVKYSSTSSVIGIGLGPTVTDKTGQDKVKYFSKSLISVKNPCLGLVNLINFIIGEDNFYSTGRILPFDGGTYIRRTN